MCKKKTSKHLIYEFKNVLRIWRLLGKHLSFDIKWKHITVGFYLGNNKTKSATLNCVISFIAIKI